MQVFCVAKHLYSALGDRSRVPACGCREIQGGSFFTNFFGGTKKFYHQIFCLTESTGLYKLKFHPSPADNLISSKDICGPTPGRYIPFM